MAIVRCSRLIYYAIYLYTPCMLMGCCGSCYSCCKIFKKQFFSVCLSLGGPPHQHMAVIIFDVSFRLKSSIFLGVEPLLAQIQLLQSFLLKVCKRSSFFTIFMKNRLYFILKFRYSEKATKIWKNPHFVLTLLSIFFKVMYVVAFSQFLNFILHCGSNVWCLFHGNYKGKKPSFTKVVKSQLYDVVSLVQTKIKFLSLHIFSLIFFAHCVFFSLISHTISMAPSS